MLKIDPKLVRQVHNARTGSDLYEPLQEAIRLEHATIPAYLCALYTIKPGYNEIVAEIIRSVVRQEMLHMTIACNLLIALGGAPAIDDPKFIPEYPGPLPMQIGGDLIVPLKKASVELVEKVFMVIEAPEDLSLREAPLDDDFATIGQFYKYLEKKILELGPCAFRRDRFANEVVVPEWFSADELFVITCPESAVRALEIVVEQGEGSGKWPFGPHDEPAHYYRFQQITLGRRIEHDPTAPYGYAFSGPIVKFDSRGVWNMFPNTKLEDLPEASQSRRVGSIFANAYTRALGQLHLAFNGDPRAIQRAIAQMYELRLLAKRVLEIPLPQAPEFSTGLSFCYLPKV